MSLTPSDETWPEPPERLRPPGLSSDLIRASDADRDEVAQVLGTAFAEGRLSHDEHDNRLSLAMTAKTLGELAPLTHDLGTHLAPAASAPAVCSCQGVAGASSQTDLLVSVFGGTERSGQWRVRRNITPLTIFGGAKLDLRDAIFESDVVEVNVVCLFGGVEIRVPEGMNVITETVNIFGGTEVKWVSAPQPGVPTLRARGIVMFGGVDIQGNKSNPKRPSRS
jgi:hypothetical protein